MEGILKIGMTKRNPDERLKDANKSDTWKPPTDYELLYSVKCYEPEKKEKLLHKLLDEYRINKNREFCRVDEEKVNIIFKMLDIEEFEDVERYGEIQFSDYLDGTSMAMSVFQDSAVFTSTSGGTDDVELALQSRLLNQDYGI